MQRTSTKRAIYYTNKLRNTIDNVCKNGGTKTIPFNIQQKIPNKLMKGAYITMQGDPEIVIYYEAFHPGTGYSWEGYYGELPKNLLFIYFNSSSSEVGEDKMKLFEKNALLNANETLKSMGVKTSLNMFYPIFVNIENREKWIPVKSLGKIKYYIKNITSQHDPLIYKYEFCMNNSICLKTNKNIYAFPLNCDVNGSIITGNNLGNLNEYNIPFELVSPCDGSLEILKTPCTCRIYKKYTLEGDKLKYIGNYTSCIKDDNGDRTCIMVETTNTKGFCTQYPCTSNCFEANFPIEKDNFTIVRYDTFTEFTSSSVEKW